MTIVAIYTLGYARLSPGLLREIASDLDVIVIDVRGRPVSRRLGFGRRQLETLLGVRYQWRGDRLGGLNHLHDARALWPGGLRELVTEVRRPLMLCRCDAPGGCHRHMLALELAVIAPAVDVTHLYHDEESDSWEAIRAQELQRAIVDGDEYTCTIWRDADEMRAQASLVGGDGVR